MKPEDVMHGLLEIGQQHIIFQQALWVALNGREIGLEVEAGPDGVKRVKEYGRIEIVNRPDGSVLVRRART